MEKAKIYECEICKKDFKIKGDGHRGKRRWGLSLKITSGSISAYEDNIENIGIGDICQNCGDRISDAIKSEINTLKPLPVVYEDDGDDDGAPNLATDLWGGAGPDCLSVPE